MSTLLLLQSEPGVDSQRHGFRNPDGNIVEQTWFLYHHLQYGRHEVLTFEFLKSRAIVDVVSVVKFHLIH